MSTRDVVRSVLTFVFAAAVLSPSAIGGEKARSGAPVPIPAADLRWVDLDPVGAPGVQLAPLWGDPGKGAFGAFFRLPAGFAAPLHTHTHDMKLVIVSGTYLQTEEGKAEFRLGPGSYLLQPGGAYRHVTACDVSAECLFFVESDGAFDLRIVESAAPVGQ